MSAAPLTRRQRELLGHLVNGLSQKEAAVAMGISWKTAIEMAAGARKRAGARSTCQLVAIFVRERW